MYCANCGIKLDDQARFCSECGAAAEPAEASARLGHNSPAPQPVHNDTTPVKGLFFLKDLIHRKGFKQAAIIGILLIAYLSYMFSHHTDNQQLPTIQQPGYHQVNQPGIPAQNQIANQEIKLELEKYDNGFFSIDKPRGWQLNTGGYGSTFCYSVQDPNQPLRQIVYYGEVGPAYLSERQKQIDQATVNMGASITWLDSPVVAPLTPANYLTKIPQILQGNFMRAVHIPPGPHWQNFQIIEVTPHKTGFVAPDAQCALIRALFTLNNQVGEGLFLVTVCTLMPENGNPFVGTSYSVCFTAVTAPQSEFRFMENSLTRSAGSAVLSQQYLAEATKNANSNWSKIFAAGQTMRETSDIIIKGWEQRNKIYDAISQKRADTIRGVRRLYNPDTNQVYTVTNDQYDQYEQNRDHYEMNNLQDLPSDSQLYLNSATDGQNIR